ncbi:MAG TPA: recombinase family protein [Bryobacteraceae bacterium]|nr:recombinase family protein [Bryobacteraceae bacterium]
MPKLTAVYTRVSTGAQDIASQVPDLERWVAANVPEASAERPPGSQPVLKWFTDAFTGKTMDRPGWRLLEEMIGFGEVGTVVVWRLDRLGRTVTGLTKLFEDLTKRGIRLVSIRDGLDLSTPAGRLMAHVLASVAQYETEVRAERVHAGQARAKAAGKKWGGWKTGVSRKVTADIRLAAMEMYGWGLSTSTIATKLKISRPTVYRVLGDRIELRRQEKAEERRKRIEAAAAKRDARDEEVMRAGQQGAD